MFNLPNAIAAALAAAMIIALMVINPARAAEPLPEIEPMIPGAVYEHFEDFRATEGLVSTFIAQGDNRPCYTKIGEVEEALGVYHINTLTVRHPVADEVVTAFYFSTVTERPWPLMIVFSNLLVETDEDGVSTVGACLDWVMILRGDEV